MNTMSSSNATSVCMLFDGIVERQPERIAVVDHGVGHTYAALQRRVAAIAEALLAHGCGPGARVCLAVRLDVDAVASVLAVLKIGAAYVPLDTRNPLLRLRKVVESSGAALVLYARQHADLVSDFDVATLCVDDLRSSPGSCKTMEPGLDALAYILFTSGSTGAPKGVGITHGNLLNYVLWAKAAYFRSPEDRIALYTTLAFDFTVTSIFPPLLAAASIGVYDCVADPMLVRDLLADRAINIIKTTPSYLHVLSARLNETSRIERLIVGGEDLPVALAARVSAQLSNRAEIINEYGPTEATVGCLFHRFDPRRDNAGSVPIGAPIPGVGIRVIDEDGAPLLNGDVGELCITGASLARGYLNDAEKTRAVFVRDPLERGGVMYRTGDLVRRNEGGDLVFIGRRDDQVKVRGNRVELAEVTAAILNVPRVTSAYVLSLKHYGSDALAALVTGSPGLTQAEIIADLERQIPPYMIPTNLKIVAEMPVTSNQKVDRAAVLRALEWQGV